MTKLNKLPLAVVALTAGSPAFAHEADFFHTHAESLTWVAALAVAGAVAFGIATKIARK